MREAEVLKLKLDELEAILKSTRELEKRQKSNSRSHYQKQQLIASLRATTYVMLYNALESAMRSVMKSIRERIEAERIAFSDAADYWRLDTVQAAFLEKMQSGTNHGMLLTDLIPLTGSSLSWDDPKRDRLPFSGNFGQASAVKLKESLPLVWAAPANTLGGIDLDNIRERRNALAHGLETFSEAGDKVTAQDLLDMLDRVRKFMLSYITALEQYRDTQGYLRPPLEVLNSGANLQEISDFSEVELPQTGG